MDKKEIHERYIHTQGLNSWEIASFKHPDFKVKMNDGPCGARVPSMQEFTNQSGILTATCFPSPAALAASWNEGVCYESAKLMGEDFHHKKTDIALCPGVNIKRSALCGRNFEYFSEDPLLSGKLAAAYINGLESTGVGATIKHYCANNKEMARLVCSSEMSLRALNEIYLASFRFALAYSKPTAIMTSYNKVNGVYVNESPYLLKQKLRDEMGFKGIIMSDWCALSDKGVAIKTGLNLEMPRSPRDFSVYDKELEDGVFSTMDLKQRDDELDEVLQGKFANRKPTDCEYDFEDAHKKAIEFASDTFVLVKNEGSYLPFKKEKRTLVIGDLANVCYFVGEGSGNVEAYKKMSFVKALEEKGIAFDYLEGYDASGSKHLSKEELSEATKGYSQIILFMGDYPGDESEARERNGISYRENQKRVLEALSQLGLSFAVISLSGSVMEAFKPMQLASSMLISYLAGEGQSEALCDVVFGEVNPSGRLPESWISRLQEMSSNLSLKKENFYYEYYDEDIYVGYRYLNQYGRGLALPFGYGLSYSRFKHHDFDVSVEKDLLLARVKVLNESDVDGKDVIEIFIGKKDSNVYRPSMELKGFAKVFVKAKQETAVEIKIPLVDLCVYDNPSDSMKVEGGSYEVYLCRNAFEAEDNKSVLIPGVELKRQMEIIPLKRKAVPNDFSIDTPMRYFLYDKEGLDLFFKQRPHLNKMRALDYFMWDGTPIRHAAYDNVLSYQEVYDLVDFLNSRPHEFLGKIKEL